MRSPVQVVRRVGEQNFATRAILCCEEIGFVKCYLNYSDRCV